LHKPGAAARAPRRAARSGGENHARVLILSARTRTCVTYIHLHSPSTKCRSLTVQRATPGRLKRGWAAVRRTSWWPTLGCAPKRTTRTGPTAVNLTRTGAARGGARASAPSAGRLTTVVRRGVSSCTAHCVLAHLRGKRVGSPTSQHSVQNHPHRRLASPMALASITHGLLQRCDPSSATPRAARRCIARQ